MGGRIDRARRDRGGVLTGRGEKDGRVTWAWKGYGQSCGRVKSEWRGLIRSGGETLVREKGRQIKMRVEGRQREGEGGRRQR